jgi:hypothetical protein
LLGRPIICESAKVEASVFGVRLEIGAGRAAVAGVVVALLELRQEDHGFAFRLEALTKPNGRLSVGGLGDAEQERTQDIPAPWSRAAGASDC